jgi:hypothetical protein
MHAHNVHTGVQLAKLAVLLGERDASSLLALFGGFYAAKRAAFQAVLEQLVSEAGPDAVGSVGRF